MKYKCNNREASSQEIREYKAFKDNNDYIKLYRSVDRISIMKDFDIKLKENILNEINKKLFLIGLKSNYYLFPSITIDRYHTNVEKKFNLSNSEKDDISVFQYIFTKLNKLIIQNGYNKEIITDFKERNPIFIKQLLALIKNIDDVLKKILLLDSINKVLIRDYYFSLIHQLYYVPFHVKSPLISTTNSLETALNFGNTKKSTEIDKIIIEYMILKQHINVFTISNNIYKDDYLLSILKRLNCPIIESPPYENQNEFSIKRALFPQFILSFLYIENNQINTTFLNPVLMKGYDLRYGFPIDQTQFIDDIKKTAYQYYGEFFWESKEFIQHNSL